MGHPRNCIAAGSALEVAALFVETGGCYYALKGVDPWDETRDARLYRGPHPVVAHPPCQRWGRFWHGSTRKPHQYALGDDSGCFAAALAAVRRCELPSLNWSAGEQRIHPRALELHGYEKARRIGMMAMVGGKDKTRIRNATPEPFRDMLIQMARSVSGRALGARIADGDAVPPQQSEGEGIV